MIEVTNLQKAYEDEVVLDSVSFGVGKGTVAVMVGPNGSGKTTTLHVLAGLATPDAGMVQVDGAEVTTDPTAAQNRLAFLPQDVRFHPALTPRQVLRFYAGLRGGSTNRLDDLLSRVDLEAAAGAPCDTLSGGMRQRLGLALLELADVPVLLLDEPALSLDPKWRRYLMDRLQSHVQSGGAVLLATHLLDVWRPIVDTVFSCENGLVREEKKENPAVSAPADPTGTTDS